LADITNLAFNNACNTLMNDLDKILTSNLVFSQAVAEALLSKGLLTKEDLKNAVTMLGYESPIPPQVEKDVRLLIDGLPCDSSSSPGSTR